MTRKRAMAALTTPTPESAANDGLDALDGLISVKIVRLGELLQRGATRAFETRFGVKNTELRILVLLSGAAPISVNELGRRTYIDKAWISRSLRGLEERGLVRRAQHPSDIRVTLVSLTKAGDALLRRVAPIAMARQARLTEGLPVKSVEHYLDLMIERAERELDL